MGIPNQLFVTQGLSNNYSKGPKAYPGLKELNSNKLHKIFVKYALFVSLLVRTLVFGNSPRCRTAPPFLPNVFTTFVKHVLFHI